MQHLLFDIGRTGNDKFIRCHLCGRKSYNAHDVREHYCGNCHLFLDDVMDSTDDHLRKQIAELRAQVARDAEAETEKEKTT